MKKIPLENCQKWICEKVMMQKYHILPDQSMLSGFRVSWRLDKCSRNLDKEQNEVNLSSEVATQPHKRSQITGLSFSQRT